MNDDPRIITLGGTEYPISPLTLGQLRTAAPAFTRIGVDTPDGMSAQITVIQAAMFAANPAVKVADVDALVGVTFAELKAAVEKIAAIMGLGKKVSATGEAAAPEAAPERVSIN